MQSSFRLDGCYRLDVGSDPSCPAPTGAIPTVCVELRHTPYGPIGQDHVRGMVPAGTVVQVNGVPFVLSENAPAESAPANWEAALPSERPGLGGFPFRCVNGDEIVFAMNLQPSYARAIASALLAAATEAR